MKKIYLIHGWGGTGSGGWFDWLKKELKDKAEVIAYDMPNTDEPKINEWVDFLEKNIKNIDKETYFIGHSIGCQAIMRFLEKFPKETKIGGSIFVAGFFNLNEIIYQNEKDRIIAKPWIETPINYNKIKNKCNNFLTIFSDNDPYIPLSDSKLFKERLQTKIIIKPNEEHFTMTQKIPEILNFIF